VCPLKTIQLSKRLKNAAEYAVLGQTVLDVGSDHAYLPIYLVQQGEIPFAIAGEVAQGPFHHAQEKVAYYGLHDRVSVRYGDGLAVLKDNEDVGTIFVCGMGGLLIRDILQAGQPASKLSQTGRLVLQSNNKEYELRTWLSNNYYHITAEAIVEEKNKIYEIIVAEQSPGLVQYSEEELKFGPKLLQAKSESFLKKWKKELETNKKILKQLEQADNKEEQQEILKKIEHIKKVIA